MADPIRIGNFFSTFDTQSVIDQLTQVRQAPIRVMTTQKTTLQQQKAALQQLGANFSAVLLRANLLADTTSVSGKTATVSGTGVLAAAGPSAAPGSFQVAVTQAASGTTATGTSLSAGVSSAVPFDGANLSIPISAGTFTIKTATGGSATIKVGAVAANTAATLATSNLATPVTAGSFTIATAIGGPVVVTVDPATQSLDDVVSAINTAGAAAGLSAAITNDTNGRPTQITLTSTSGNVTVGAAGDTSNFLTATRLTGTTGTATVTSSGPFTVMETLDQVFADINGSGVGVTATIQNDANGKPNIVQLTSTQGALTLGLGSDTSNFLAATNLLASPGTTTRASTVGIARLNAANKMADTSFAGGPPAAGAHTFTVNGVSIVYNTAQDSLNDVIGRINASSAGVSARYDAYSDTIKLTQTKTGSTAISLADDASGGDFLAKMGLASATQTLGANAQYSIDGGPTLYSDSNTVTVSGATLTLTGPTGATPATVTVASDSSGGLTAMRNFVAEFNGLMDGISAATKHDATAGNEGPLSGDTSLLAMQATLRSLVTGLGTNLSGRFSSLSDIGLSYGAVGSAVGSTTKLVFDESKFNAALASDPASVQSLLSEVKLGASLAGGGTGSVTGVSGTYAGSTTGAYQITDDGAGNLTAVFTPDNGGAAITTTGTITAGGSNTTLIPGMTLTAGALQAGTNTVLVTPTSQSVVARIRDYIDTQYGTGGVLTQRLTTYDKRMADLDTRMQQIQDGIDSEMTMWRQKFTAMEQAEAKAQSIMSQLTATMAKTSSS